LIALLLFNRLLQLLPGEMVKEISPVKTWHRMREKFDDYLKELKQAGQLAVVKIIDWIARRARSASRKKDPSTLSLLKQAAKNLQIIRLLDPLAYLRAYQEKLSDLSAFLSRVCLPAQKTANGDSIFCQ
jgi:23S rRNA pseudoU1915 N3-methylase RlmH